MKIKTLFVTIDASQTGGIERSLSNLLPKLNGYRNLEITLISCFGDSVKAKFKYPRVNVQYIGIGSCDFINGKILAKLYNYFLLAFRIFKIDLKSFDRIVSVYPVITILMILLHPGQISKIYSWEHSQMNAHSFLLNFLRKKLYIGIKALLVLTEQQRVSFESISKRICIIPNAFQPLQLPQKAYKTKTWNIVGIGRLSPEKGFDRFISTLAELKKSRIDWEASICGEGFCRPLLERQIVELGLTNHIRLRGEVDNPLSIYGSADITAICSRSEVFGMVILESMSAGVPVISYDAGEGPRDLITSGKDGILIEDGNKQAFCDGLKQLMENTDYYNSLVHGGHVKSDQYRVERILEIWYQELKNE